MAINLFMEDMETLPSPASTFMYLNYDLDSEVLAVNCVTKCQVDITRNILHNKKLACWGAVTIYFTEYVILDYMAAF